MYFYIKVLYTIYLKKFNAAYISLSIYRMSTLKISFQNNFQFLKPVLSS